MKLSTITFFALFLLSSIGLFGQAPCATPSGLTATPSSVCPGGTTLLNAISTGNSINWYTVPTGGVSLGSSASGANFSVTPAATTTYYAEAVQISGGSQTFNYTGTIQNFVVPSGTTSITIDAKGAQGGNTNGGKGARMIGTFTVTPGETIGIVVGQQGVVNNCGGAGASGGGGGGSFIWRLSSSVLPLVVAGGGGGGNTNWSGGCIVGIDAVTTQNGTQGNGATSAMGGTSGAGGFGNAPSGTGSGGAGWSSAGQNSTYGGGCTGGQGPFSFTAGNGSTTFGPGGQGGYGGGGGAVCGCGGGGGYSGGGGGEGSSCRAGGGGGGSYNAGTSQANTTGVQFGNGQVVITWGGTVCTASTRTVVTVTLETVSTPPTSISGGTTVCPGGTTTLTQIGGVLGTGAVYEWYAGTCGGTAVATGDSITVSPTGTTTYYVYAEGNCNTTTCDSIVVTVGPAINGSLLADTTVCGYNVSCNGGNDGVATANATGGCPGYTYVWSTGDTTGTVTGLGAGTYFVTITDGNGSTFVDSVSLNAPSAIQVSDTTEASCFVDSTGAIDIAVTGGNDCQGYSFLWSTGDTTEDISGVGAGSYTVTVTDGGGCTSTQSVTVSALAALNPTFTQSGNTLTAGQSWSSYQWLLNNSNIGGANANTYSFTQSGTYSLMVTDSNGCSGLSDTSTVVGVIQAMGDWMDLSIFPNPARSEFRLRTASPIGYGITVSISDMFGRRIYTQGLPELGHEVAFDIKAFAAGTYMVEVVSEMGLRKLFRLVVQ